MNHTQHFSGYIMEGSMETLQGFFRTFFDEAAPIRKQLGSWDYLLDNFQTLLFTHDIPLCQSAAQRGTEHALELYSLYLVTKYHQHLGEAHPFYGVVSRYAQDIPYLYVYPEGLPNAYLHYAAERYFMELTKAISSLALNEDIQLFADAIAESLENPAAMKTLLTLYKDQYIACRCLTAYLHSLAEGLYCTPTAQDGAYIRSLFGRIGCVAQEVKYSTDQL